MKCDCSVEFLPVPGGGAAAGGAALGLGDHLSEHSKVSALACAGDNCI